MKMISFERTFLKSRSVAFISTSMKAATQKFHLKFEKIGRPERCKIKRNSGRYRNVFCLFVATFLSLCLNLSPANALPTFNGSNEIFNIINPDNFTLGGDLTSVKFRCVRYSEVRRALPNNIDNNQPPKEENLYALRIDGNYAAGGGYHWDPDGFYDTDGANDGWTTKIFSFSGTVQPISTMNIANCFGINAAEITNFTAFGGASILSQEFYGISFHYNGKEYRLGVDDTGFVNTSTVLNQAPAANAGPDQTVTSASLVTLNGGDSSDPDGDTLSYSWSQISGTAVSLSGTNTATPSFTAPTLAVNAPDAVLTFQLIVNDGTVNSSPDTVNVTVESIKNNAPTLSGTPLSALVVEDVSSDLDLNAATFADADTML